MVAVLQQRVQDAWQTLAFFSRKLSPAQQKYSAHDRELLAIYETVRYFRHRLEARHFTILTDHKPLTFAFHQKMTVAHHANLPSWTLSQNSQLTSDTYPAGKTSSPTRSPVLK
jgi:hypothetical protein